LTVHRLAVQSARIRRSTSSPGLRRARRPARPGWAVGAGQRQM